MMSIKETTMKKLLTILCTLIISYGFSQPTDYVAYYPFSGDASDASGNGNTGTINGTLTASSDKNAAASSAYTFDGSTSYITTSLTFSNNQPLTVSMWVNWDGTTGDQTAVSWFDAGLTNRLFFGVNGSGQLVFGDGFQTGTALSSSSWVHLAATYDGSQSRIYINGVLSDVSSTGLTYQFDNLTIGRQGSNSTEYWDGQIDEIQIFDRAVSATEVNDIFLSSLSPDAEALMAIYDGTDGDFWTNNTGWGTDPDINNWHGVTADGSGNVTGLDLSDNNLNGTLPTEITQLTSLQSLTFENNTSLSGGIPSDIGNLTNLTYLRIANCAITGTVPTSLSNLTGLTNLYLMDTQLTGDLPDLSSMTGMEVLELRSNNFTGEVGDMLSGLSNLTFLSLHTNAALTGELPAYFYDGSSPVLDEILFSGTDICEPSNTAFSDWAASITNFSGTAITCISNMGIVGTALAAPSNTTEHFLERTGTDTFRGVVYFTDGSLNFQANSDAGSQWGDDGLDGVAGEGEASITVTEGLYDVGFNFVTGDYFLINITNSTVNFLGSAVRNDNSAWWFGPAMNNVGTGLYGIPLIYLHEGGEWKIRLDGSWNNLDFGSTSGIDDNFLEVETGSDANVVFEGTSGFYSVYVDIIDLTYEIGPADDLLGYYTFDADVLDYSGNGNDASLVNGSEAYTSDRFSTAGAAIAFEGSTNYTTSLIPAQNESFSASFWFRWDGPSANQDEFREFLSWYNGATDNAYIGIDEGLGNIIRFGDFYANTGVTAPQTAWTHLVAVYDHSNGEAIVYMNGNEVARQSSVSAPIMANMNIGSLDAAGSELFNGLLDDVLVFQKPLNFQEVNDLYAADNFANTRISNVNIPGVSSYNFWVTDYLDAVTISVPSDTDLSNLAPEFTIDPNSTIDPPSGTIRDFNQFQTYSVTSISGDVATHHVIVVKEGDISTFTDEKLHGNWSAVTTRPYIRIGDVGGNPAHTGWMQLPEGITVQSCETDDIFQFNPDGTFVIDDQGETWLTPAQTGIARGNDGAYGCGDPSLGSPYNQFTSDTYGYSNDANSITVEGEGAYIVLSDVYNGGNYNETGDVAVQSSVTYNVYHYEERDGVAYMTLNIQPNLTEVWHIELQHALLNETAITYFSLPEEEDPASFNASTIDIEVAFGSDLSNLTPDIQVSPGATISPASGETVDFSSGSVSYTVTAQDGSSAEVWTVNVTVAPQFDNTEPQIEYFKYSRDWPSNAHTIDGLEYRAVSHWQLDQNQHLYLEQLNDHGEILWATEDFILYNGDDGISGIHIQNMDQDSNGNLFAFGSFSGTITINSTDYTVNGNEDLIVLKYDPNGNLIAFELIEGPDSGGIGSYGLLVLNTDEVLISLWSNADFNYDGFDFLEVNGHQLVVKFDNALGRIDQTQDLPHGQFAQLPDNSVYIAASGLYEIDPSNLTQLNHYLAPAGSGTLGHGSRIVYNSSGEIIFTGLDAASGDGTEDIFIGKFNPGSATWIWYDIVGGIGLDEVTHLEITNDDLIYIYGLYENAWSWSAFDLNSKGGRDLFLAKIGDAGDSHEVLWVQEYGSSDGDDYLMGMTLDPVNDEVTLYGASPGTDFDFLGYNPGMNQSWQARLSLDGPDPIPSYEHINGFGVNNTQTNGASFNRQNFDDQISNDFTLEGLFNVSQMTLDGTENEDLIRTDYMALQFVYADWFSIPVTMITFHLFDETAGDSYSIDTPINFFNLSSDNWHHYAVTLEGNIMTVYLDGIPVNSTIVPWSNRSSTVSNQLQVAPDQDGRVDELRLWNEARTAQQIRDFAQTEINPASFSDLIGNWRFNDITDNGDGTYATSDETSNAQDLIYDDNSSIILPLDAPTLTAANVLTNSFTVNWNTVDGATSYNIQVSSDDTFSSIFIDESTTETFFDVTGLSPSTAYYARARSDDGSITSAFSGTLTVTTEDLPAGLLAYYPLSTTDDESGNGYHLTQSTGSIQQTVGVDDVSNGAYLFEDDGAHLFIELMDDGWNSINTELTVNAWINPTSFPVSGAWIDKVCTFVTADGPEITLAYSANGELVFHWYDDNADEYPSINSGSNMVDIGQWQMITLTVNSNNDLKLYYNGIEISEYFNNGETISPNGLSIVETDITSFEIASDEVIGEENRYMDGAVDEVSVYNAVLSASEITALYELYASETDNTAPTVSITTSAPNGYVKGGDGVTITANVTDDNSGVSTVEIYGGRIEDEVVSGPFDMTSVGGDDYEVTLPDNLFDDTGLFFYVVASDAAGNSVTTEIETISTIVSGGTEVVDLPTGTETVDYGIISIPFQNLDVSSAIPELDNYNNTKDQFRLFRFNASNQTNGLQEYNTSGFTSFEPGRGYWFLSASQATATIQTQATAVSTSATGEFPMTLQTGWNLIGNPFRSDINWVDVLSANGNPNISLLYFYNNGDYTNNNSILGDFRGAFVNNGTGSAITINIPVSAMNAKTISSSANASQSHGIPGSKDWTMELDILHNKMASKVSSIGMNNNSTDGVDPHEYKPLPHFDEFVELAFESGRIMDFASVKESNIWKFDVNSSFVGEDMSISWDNFGMRDNDYNLLLQDLVNDRFIDMSEFSSYSFTQQSESHTFQIYFAHEDEVYSMLELSQTAVGDPFPNPFTEKLKVPVAVSENSGTLSMAVYDIMGKKQWHQVVSLDHSYQELEFTYDELGLDINGTYILKFQLDTEKNSKAFTKRITFFR